MASIPLALTCVYCVGEGWEETKHYLWMSHCASTLLPGCNGFYGFVTSTVPLFRQGHRHIGTTAAHPNLSGSFWSSCKWRECHCQLELRLKDPDCKKQFSVDESHCLSPSVRWVVISLIRRVHSQWEVYITVVGEISFQLAPIGVYI